MSGWGEANHFAANAIFLSVKFQCHFGDTVPIELCRSLPVHSAMAVEEVYVSDAEWGGVGVCGKGVLSGTEEKVVSEQEHVCNGLAPV